MTVMEADWVTLPVPTCERLCVRDGVGVGDGVSVPLDVSVDDGVSV